MKKIHLLLALILASSCSLGEQKFSRLDYLDKGSRIDIKRFFDGKIEGFAIVQDEKGDISDTSVISVEASWEDNKGVIKQTYKYANGEKDGRTWLITLDNGGETFSAIGHDVATPAQGRKAGNAMQMIYSLLLQGNMKGQKETVRFDDKYYLTDENSAIVISESYAGFAGKKTKTIMSLKRLSPIKAAKQPAYEAAVEAAPAKVKKDVKVESATSSTKDGLTKIDEPEINETIVKEGE